MQYIFATFKNNVAMMRANQFILEENDGVLTIVTNACCSGKYKILVTSQVLNEGVDVPEASIGIVVSGTASSREHIQRLGRILRPSPGKAQAVLYELVSAGTSEESVSTRRRTLPSTQ